MTVCLLCVFSLFYPPCRAQRRVLGSPFLVSSHNSHVRWVHLYFRCNSAHLIKKAPIGCCWLLLFWNSYSLITRDKHGIDWGMLWACAAFRNPLFTFTLLQVKKLHLYIPLSQAPALKPGHIVKMADCWQTNVQKSAPFEDPAKKNPFFSCSQEPLFPPHHIIDSISFWPDPSRSVVHPGTFRCIMGTTGASWENLREWPGNFLLPNSSVKLANQALAFL